MGEGSGPESLEVGWDGRRPHDPRGSLQPIHLVAASARPRKSPGRPFPLSWAGPRRGTEPGKPQVPEPRQGRPFTAHRAWASPRACKVLGRPRPCVRS